MEKKQVQASARTIIGYQRGYGRNRPAAVIDGSTLWMESGGGTRPTTFTRSTDNRYSHDSSWSGYHTVGYLTLIAHDSDYDEHRRTAALEALADLLATMPDSADLTGEYVRILSKNLPEGLTLDIVNNRYLYGPTWEAVEAAERAEAAAKEERRAEDRRKAEARRETLVKIALRVEAAGFAPYAVRTEDNGRVSLPVSVLAQLLDIEPGDAE